MTIQTLQSPNIDDISRYAYMLYQERGCQPGHELEDWLKAETILCAKGANNGAPVSTNGDKKAPPQPIKPTEIKRSKLV